MVNSMTGFANLTGEHAPFRWTLDLRSVNARGLDIRLRIPDWLPGLEQPLRSAIQSGVTRGSLNMSLRLQRDETVDQATLDPVALRQTLSSIAEIEYAAHEQGLNLAPVSAADILAVRGVQKSGATDDDTDALSKAVLAGMPALLKAFNAMRATEGKALLAVLAQQLDRVAELVDAAAEIVLDRQDAVTETLRTNLAKVLENADGADPDRVAQELAMLAVKNDVTEELDRLRAHIQAARDLLGTKGAVGRKLDFLMQEFNREANTLCSKSNFTALTQVGLDLKAVIDQMREQVQNVE